MVCLAFGLAYLCGVFDDPGIKETIPEPVLRFGLPVDSFYISEGIIRPNQNLSDILMGYGVGLATIDVLARRAQDTFDVRKIKCGNNFFVFQSRDSLREAKYFVYENTTTSYVIFDLADSLKAYLGQKEVESRIKTASGVISSSLWNTMVDNRLSPLLAIELSEIYAWSIDFFGIQKGDWFKIVYEEQYVDSQSIGIGEIHAALFNHAGQDFYAFRFYQDNRFDYFDISGSSLRKAFLKAPMKWFSRISSRFSNNRFHPVLKIHRAHHGVDYAAPTGTPVQSIGDGLVIERAFQASGGGNYVRIKHNSVYSTTYMHLSKFGEGIYSGARVRQGQVIGYVGATGLASGPHLDFRVYKNGQAIDPLRMEAPPVEPVKTQNLPRFVALRDSMATLIKNIPDLEGKTVR